MLIWLAAANARPGTDYAILGDDVVIADEKVAQESKKLMDDCEVTISKEKSLFSTTGAMEFAKRFIADDGRNNLSPRERC